MFLATVILFCVTFVNAVPHKPNAAQVSIQRPETTSLTGGTKANVGDIPYHVRIQTDSGSCAGALISADFVLTAARYTHNAVVERIVIGDIDAGHSEVEEVAAQYFKAIEIIVHADYNDTTREHDIALIRLDRFAELHPRKVYPIRLAAEEPLLGEPTIISGLGDVEGTGYHHMKYDEVLVTSFGACQDAYDHLAEGRQICVQPDIDLALCASDIGNPLANYERNELYGIGSIVHDTYCDVGGALLVYTKVSRYLDWINNHSGAAP